MKSATSAAPNGVCLITGVGPGTGAALARHFAAGGYEVAMLARDAERLARLEAELPGARAFPCDVGDPKTLGVTVQQVCDTIGTPTIVVHNAVGGTFGAFADINPEDFERNFRVKLMALLYLARAVTPSMVRVGAGALVVTGNTAAHRGTPNFAGFAPTKAAQRILAQSIARDLGPKRVHVAYLTIDAVIDVAWTRERFADKSDTFFIQPSAIADEVWHLVHQPRSAWSFDVELRPFAEHW